LRFLLVHLVHNSFWFSRIHLHFALGQRFFSIFYAEIFWDVVRLDLSVSKLHIRRPLRILLNFCIFLTFTPPSWERWGHTAPGQHVHSVQTPEEKNLLS
jgi:hypothetical protein